MFMRRVVAESVVAGLESLELKYAKLNRSESRARRARKLLLAEKT